MDKFVMGIDIGSGSVKLTLLSRDGNIRATEACEYPTFYPRVGWSEQDPEDWCRATKSAFEMIRNKTGIKAAQIEALALDAATHTAVLLDNDRQVIRNAILWTDQRSASQVKYLKENYGELIRQQVCNEPTTVWTLPQLMWLKENEPEVWEKISYILFAKDYLRYRLSGTMETDYIDAMGSMFFNATENKWSKELCKIGGIDMNWLPKVLRPDERAGTVTKQAASEFGLCEGTEVFVGTTDTVMEVFAAGNVKEGHATVKLATAGRICMITDHAVDSPFIFNYRHVIDGLWYPGTATGSCANSYRWYRDALGGEAYEELNKGAEKIPVGSDGLIFHPYLNGELTPYNDPLLKGDYIGISARHTKAHFTRATLEGVAFSLRDCLDTVKKLGIRMDRVRIIGGGAKGMLWRQIVADVLDLRLEKICVDDSSFGTAMLAAVAAGWYGSYEEAAESCIRIESITEPIPENVEKYNRIFEYYKAVTTALKPIYDSRY